MGVRKIVRKILIDENEANKSIEENASKTTEKICEQNNWFKILPQQSDTRIKPNNHYSWEKYN